MVKGFEELAWFYFIICPILVSLAFLFGICLINDLIYEAGLVVFAICFLGALSLVMVSLGSYIKIN